MVEEEDQEAGVEEELEDKDFRDISESNFKFPLLKFVFLQVKNSVNFYFS